MLDNRNKDDCVGYGTKAQNCHGFSTVWIIQSEVVLVTLLLRNKVYQ